MVDPVTILLGLAQFAPVLMRYLGVGEAPVAVAERVIDIAGQVTGAKTPEDITAALTASAEKREQFKIAVMQNSTELDRLYMADRADARARDVEFVRAGRWNYRADFLALLSVGGLVMCVWFVARDSGMTERAVNAIMFVAGVLASAVRDVFSFEFGTSRGSEQKQATLDELLKKRPG